MITFEQLCELEPRLAELAAQVRAERRQRGYCGDARWYSYFKPQMAALVGFNAQRRDDALLRSPQAYDTALDHLYYELLPRCRHRGPCPNWKKDETHGLRFVNGAK
jgi:hypothetical protein